MIYEVPDLGRGESTSENLLSFFNQSWRQSQHRPIGVWTATQHARIKMVPIVESEYNMEQDCWKMQG